MSACNATLVIFDEQCETIRCYDHDDLCEQPHGAADAAVRWDDSALGAKPHTPSTDYEVREGYCVTYGLVPLRWYGPNRYGAEVEAKRLRESGETPENYEKRLKQGLAEQERDEARRRVSELEGREDEWSEWAGARLSERDRARRERDAFRAALETIAHARHNIGRNPDGEASERIAREALRDADHADTCDREDCVR